MQLAITWNYSCSTGQLINPLVLNCFVFFLFFFLLSENRQFQVQRKKKSILWLEEIYFILLNDIAFKTEYVLHSEVWAWIAFTGAFFFSVAEFPK